MQQFGKDKRFIPAGAGNTLSVSPLRPLFTVYPRWRGKRFDQFRVCIEIAGLSPLARGTLCKANIITWLV
ncbi:hypothetical protein ACTLIY_003964, partial [Cronobacter turicensis]